MADNATKNFTLDDIKAAADRKFGHFTLEIGEETVVMRNALRMPKEERKEMLSLQNKINSDAEGEEEVDEEALVAELLRLVCENKHQANVLETALDGDMALYMTVFEEYAEATQSGEASGSQD